MRIGKLLGKKEKPKYDDTRLMNIAEKPTAKKVGNEYRRININPSK